MWRTPEFTGHALYRHSGSMTLTQALKENMGDPERGTYPADRPRASKRRGLTKENGVSFQEVGLSHSSEEVR